MRISDWSSDVCSSDLSRHIDRGFHRKAIGVTLAELRRIGKAKHRSVVAGGGNQPGIEAVPVFHTVGYGAERGRIVFERYRTGHDIRRVDLRDCRSEEHTAGLQSLMSNSYSVFCLKKYQKENTKKHIKSKYY